MKRWMRSTPRVSARSSSESNLGDGEPFSRRYPAAVSSSVLMVHWLTSAPVPRPGSDLGRSQLFRAGVGFQGLGELVELALEDGFDTV